MKPNDVVVLSAMLACTLGLLAWRDHWTFVNKKEFFSLVVMAAIGTLVGARILLVLPEDLFRVFVGLTVLVSCFILWKSDTLSLSSGSSAPWIAGTIAGLMNGLVALPGPPMIIYSLSHFTIASRSRALLTCFFTVSAAIALLVYAGQEMLRGQTAVYAAWCVPALVLGDKLGSLLFTRYGTAMYRKVALCTLATMGLVTLLQALTRLSLLS